MKIYVTGDTHRTHDIGKLSLISFPEQIRLSHEDYVIILGDVAIAWTGDENDIYTANYHNNKPYTTLFLDGNHENHAILDAYPVEMWNGGKIHRIAPNVLHLMRGQTFRLGDVSFFVMGGASSIDKKYRIENVSWWSREIPSDAEFEEGIANLEKCGNKVNFILTHDAPHPIRERLGCYTRDPLTSFLTFIDSHIQFEKWYFGHHHVDANFDDKYFACYNTIEQIV